MRHFMKWTACLGIAAVAVLAVAGAFPHEEHEGEGHECVACHFLLCGAMSLCTAAAVLAVLESSRHAWFVSCRDTSLFSQFFLGSLPSRGPPA
jgi:hypothetical protein